MSVLYSIVPFVEEYYSEFVEYLADFGIEIPTGTKSRYPTPLEIRQALDEMPEYTKRYSISHMSWDVDIYETAFYDQELRRSRGKYASINSVGPAPDETIPLHIYFHGGTDEVNLEIVMRLTKFTGPLVLMAESDAIPVLVTHGDNVSDLMQQWQRNYGPLSDVQEL
jgi:hypothetical protein